MRVWSVANDCNSIQSTKALEIKQVHGADMVFVPMASVAIVRVSWQNSIYCEASREGPRHLNGWSTYTKQKAFISNVLCKQRQIWYTKWSTGFNRKRQRCCVWTGSVSKHISLIIVLNKLRQRWCTWSVNTKSSGIYLLSVVRRRVAFH